MNRREKVLLSILFLLMGGYVYYHYLYSPLQMTADRLARENDGLNSKIMGVEQKIQHLQTVSVSEEEIDSQYGKLAEKVPNQLYIPEVLAFMEQSAEESQIILLEAGFEFEPPSSQAQSEPGEQQNYQYQTLHITAQGNYHALCLFISKIENDAVQMLNITSLNLQIPSQRFSLQDSGSTDPGEGYVYDDRSITAEMQIMVFYDDQGFPGSTPGGALLPYAAGKDNPFQIGSR